MFAAWRSIARTVIDLRFIGITLIYFNLLWFFCSIPLITLPPATAALYVVVRKLEDRHEVSWRDFFQAMRDQFVVGWRWGLVNLVVDFLFVVNYWFYSQLAAPLDLLLTALLTGILLTWLLVQMYTYPVLLQQAQPQVRQALRNAFALCMRYPVFTLIHALTAGVFIFISLVVPYFWMIFTTGLVFYIYSQAVTTLLKIERGEDPFATEEYEL
jgi:uncharacterized membrane protein YesL